MSDEASPDEFDLTMRRIPQPRPGKIDSAGITDAFAHRMMYSVAKDEFTASEYDVYQALAYTIRDRMMERWFHTQKAYYESNAKRVYYLSLEFLMGRALLNNVLNLGAFDATNRAMRQLGYRLEELEEQEADAGLGNGGLGRLAACMLDSAATLALPVYGYGIRYEYGIFRQQIENGFQVEQPDNWLRYGNPWEIPRHDAVFPVKFYGRGQHYVDEGGVTRFDWVDTEDIYAMAYDVPVIGYRNDTVNSLRLWAAKSSREFDLNEFNAGNYVRAVEQKNQTENISKVLYPPDDQYAGKELRLKQQYFFVSATLQDVIRRYKKQHESWDEFPSAVAIQLNDTHPAVAIPELMRIFIDSERLEWDAAWEITRQVFGYTNHTVLPEALETWSTELFGRLLPRHLQIVEEVDRRLREFVKDRYPEDPVKVSRTAIIDDSEHVRMANLAIIGSRSVNGVARLHSEIIREEIFPDFYEMFPERFNNKTNGITPRRWLLKCNRRLSSLITEAIGEKWVRDLDELQKLRAYEDDASFRERWAVIKRQNKDALSSWASVNHGFTIEPDWMLDCQVKRIHEYKRQLLNIMRVIALFHRIREGEVPEVPRTVLFSGKAAPGYLMAKLVIKLANSVSAMIARDPVASRYLKVVFVPNYGVTAAEMIFPACDLSEQISTAGTEASGTGNMKAALNGAITIGTLDGANVEIREEVGEENIFIFGHTAEEIAELRRDGPDASAWIANDDELMAVIRTIENGELIDADTSSFQTLASVLRTNDRYFHCADFRSYVEMHARVDETYLRPNDWITMSIRNVAGLGKFSSDRTVQEYARDIWDAKPVPVDIGQLRLSYSGDERRSR